MTKIGDRVKHDGREYIVISQADFVKSWWLQPVDHPERIGDYVRSRGPFDLVEPFDPTGKRAAATFTDSRGNLVEGRYVGSNDWVVVPAYKGYAVWHAVEGKPMPGSWRLLADAKRAADNLPAWDPDDPTPVKDYITDDPTRRRF